jgi:FkbM family methyltransferase
MSDLSRLARLHPVYLSFFAELRGLDVLPRDPRRAAPFVPALEALQGNDLAGALAALTRAIAAGGDAAHAAMLRALVFMLMNDADAAGAVFDAALADHPPHPGLHLLAGRHFMKEGRFAAAADAFRRAAELDPANGAAFGALAVMHGLVGDWDRAALPAARARALGEEFGPNLVRLTSLFAQLHQGGTGEPEMDLRPLDGRATDAAFLGALPAVDGGLRSADQTRPIVFVGCDERYLAEHVPTLAYSLEAQGEPVTLHVHVFGGGAATGRVIAGLLPKLSVVAVALTIEPEGGAPAAPRNVYYACARFIRAWQVLCANDVPVMAVDADVLFNRPLSQFPGFDGAAADVSVCSQPEESPAWEQVIAGAVLLLPTPAARAWLGAVAATIAANLLGTGSVWFLDQIALSLAFQRRPGGARILASPFARSCDTRHGEAAVIWAVTVDKSSESAFLARRRALARRFEGAPAEADANPNEVVRSAYGLMIVNRHDMYIGPTIKATGHWCPAEVEAMAALIRPGATVFDVGANFGFHTLAFSRFVGPAGKVFAFEPQRLVWQSLVGSLALNWVRNVHALNVAVGDRSGEIQVPPISYQSHNNIGAVSLRDGWQGSQEVAVLEEAAEAVPAIRLDDANIGACDLIKIDVEGMEMAVLSGAAGLIRSLRPVCYVEFHTDKDAIVAFFAELGYRLFLHAIPGNPNLLCLPDASHPVPAVPHLTPLHAPAEAATALSAAELV